jgi:hypothetical protein
MHFGDEFHKQHNQLILGIYIHEVLGTDDTELTVTSMLYGVMIDPHLLNRTLSNPEKLRELPEVAALKTETFYIVTFVDVGGSLTVKTVEETDPRDEFDWQRIH